MFTGRFRCTNYNFIIYYHKSNLFYQQHFLIIYLFRTKIQKVDLPVEQLKTSGKCSRKNRQK